MSRALPPALLLAAYAVAFGLAAFGGGLPVFDDHPGQIYRLYHAVTVGWAPWRFNPGWWAGYAELQYYPPGAAWLGAAIHGASMGALGVPRSYEVVLWIAWALPGVTTFVLLTRVLGSGWLALPGAFVALTLSAGSRSGVEEGLRWGLVAARLGWGLLPLVALSLLSWVEHARRAPLSAGVLIAAVILLHPAHAPAALALLAIGAWLGRGERRRRMAQGGAVIALALGLSALWLLPLLAHLSMALPLAWGDSSALGLLRQIGRPLIVVMALTQLAAWLSMRRGGDIRATERWLQTFTPVMIVATAFDAFVATPLGVTWLPADRLVDSVLLALIIGASLAGPQLVARAAPLGGAGIAVGLLAGALALSGGAPEPALTLWPSPGQWPTRDQVVRGVRLDALWRLLRTAPPGRVLFLRSAVPLDFRPEWWRPHSHITALTPIESGRDIINGTFTHPSPIAGLLYTGSAAIRPITMLVEVRDGRSLFGRRLESITAAEFRAWAEQLRISAVVVSEDDGRLSFLDESGDFAPPREVGPFRVYLARASHPLPEPAGAQAWRVKLAPGRQGWGAAGFAYSPLWQALGDGRPLSIRRDDHGMLEVDAQNGAGEITLSHRPGMAEGLGVLISILSATALLLAVTRGIVKDVASPHHSA